MVFDLFEIEKKPQIQFQWRYSYKLVPLVLTKFAFHLGCFTFIIIAATIACWVLLLLYCSF